MVEYLLKITGVHYAANPDSVAGIADTGEMHERTREMLTWIKTERPFVVLSADPENHFNPDAVMARAQGRRIGYVGDECLMLVRSLLAESEAGMLLGRVKDVVVKEHGWLWIVIDAEELTQMQPLTSMEIEWQMWLSDIALLPTSDNLLAEQEAAFVLDYWLLPRLDEVDIKDLKTYLDIWLRGSRHDLSREARQKRSAYIERLEAAQNKEVRQLAEALKIQRTSICGRPMLNERTGTWWKDMMESKNVKRLWNQWQIRHEGRLWNGLRQIDAMLRQLPGELYEDVGQLDEMLSRLYYMNTPRQAFQAILALLMLRQLTCCALKIEMRPMTEDEYGKDGLITNPMDMPTTIGRVVAFGETQCELPLQRQTIQLLAQWLRDDYEQSHSKEIEALTEKKNEPSVNIAGDLVMKKEMNIDKNFAPNIEHNGGTLSLPDKKE